MKTRIHLIAVMAVYLAGAASAASISSTFSEILVENLQPGQRYSLAQIANLPYNIKNSSDRDINIKIEVIKPKKGTLRPDFEVIPDTGWVSLQNVDFTLAQNEAKTSDVIIRIPKKSKYLNKKYQVNIWSRTVEGGGGFGVSTGLESVLLLTTDKAFVDAIESPPGDHPEARGGLDFQVQPREIIAFSTSTENPALKVTNTGSAPRTFKLTCLTAREALTRLREGYLDCPDPSFLAFSEPEFTLAAGGEKEVKLSLHFPDKKKYKNKKYMFVVYTMCGNTGGIYSRLLVETK